MSSKYTTTKPSSSDNLYIGRHGGVASGKVSMTCSTDLAGGSLSGSVKTSAYSANKALIGSWRSGIAQSGFGASGASATASAAGS
mmetsp:Transcript_27406/g.59950  ORF Transcript_27406/g.59950 Transcript_27406/m.59950 type:complete len:85 (-) Transcript_27406:1014-1268(-)